MAFLLKFVSLSMLFQMATQQHKMGEDYYYENLRNAQFRRKDMTDPYTHTRFVPGNTERISCWTDSSTSLYLRWDYPPESYGMFRYFIVRYKQIGWNHHCLEPSDNTIMERNVSYMSFRVEYLKPSAIYHFAVTVKEEFGPTTTCATEMDVPSAAPRDLTLSDGYKTLTWEEPPCSMSNGKIKDYWITMKSFNDWDKTVINQVTTKMQFDMPATTPYTNYSVKIFASTKAGYSKVFAEYFFKTEAEDPPIPTSFKIYSQNLSALYLAWRPPHPPYGILLKYEIRYKLQETQVWKVEADIPLTKCTISTVKGNHCYTLTNLTSHKTYSIQIKAFNKNFTNGSDYSQEIKGVTTELIPGPPSSVTVAGRNENSITINWTKPEITNGKLLNYRVNMFLSKSYSSLADETSFKNRTETINVPETRWTSRDLWPATIYSFAIKAQTSAGYGPAVTTSAYTTIRAHCCGYETSSDASKDGVISSPNYPEPYPANAFCIYQFVGRGKERVQIIFTDFDLHLPHEPPRDCESVDALTVFITIDGQKERLDNFCGNKLPNQIMSNGPTMSVEFRSFHTSPEVKGFRATYRFVKDFGITGGRQKNDSVCAFTFRSEEGRNGTFTSPNYPGFYPRDTECHYFFEGKPKERVLIAFDHFDVDGIDSCTEATASDYVEFSSFVLPDGQVPRYCGKKKPNAVESDGEYFHLSFKSNGKFDRTGFKALYEFKHTDDPLTVKRVPKTVETSSYGTTYQNRASALTLAFILLTRMIL